MSINKKQKLTLICGIVAIILGAINAIADFYHPGFDIYLVVIILVTAGCFYNFRDKDKKTQDKEDIDK
jgi:hypothetical protein